MNVMSNNSMASPSRDNSTFVCVSLKTEHVQPVRKPYQIIMFIVFDFLSNHKLQMNLRMIWMIMMIDAQTNLKAGDVPPGQLLKESCEETKLKQALHSACGSQKETQNPIFKQFDTRFLHTTHLLQPRQTERERKVSVLTLLRKTEVIGEDLRIFSRARVRFSRNVEIVVVNREYELDDLAERKPQEKHVSPSLIEMDLRPVLHNVLHLFMTFQKIFMDVILSTNCSASKLGRCTQYIRFL